MPEIERKFLVDLDQAPRDLGPGSSIRQAYVAVDGDVEVRARQRDGACTLTVKGGRGLERAEIEVAIDRDQFEELWRLANARRLDKSRHEIPVGDHTAELDVYAGRLAGLRVVEVEFASRADAEAFQPPAWFGEELTGDARWSNAALATSGRPLGEDPAGP